MTKLEKIIEDRAREINGKEKEKEIISFLEEIGFEKDLEMENDLTMYILPKKIRMRILEENFNFNVRVFETHVSVERDLQHNGKWIYGTEKNFCVSNLTYSNYEIEHMKKTILELFEVFVANLCYLS